MQQKNLTKVVVMAKNVVFRNSLLSNHLNSSTIWGKKESGLN